MAANYLVGEIASLSAAHGNNLPIILQADSEGNSYSFMSGVAFCYISKDMDTTYDSLEEAQSYGLHETELLKVLVIYP